MLIGKVILLWSKLASLLKPRESAVALTKPTLSPGESHGSHWASQRCSEVHLAASARHGIISRAYAGGIAITGGRGFFQPLQMLQMQHGDQKHRHR